MESPSQFKQKLKELNQRYFLIIDEVVKTYPNYKIKENEYKFIAFSKEGAEVVLKFI